LLVAFGSDNLITFGLANVDTIRKKSSKMNRMSFNAEL